MTVVFTEEELALFEVARLQWGLADMEETVEFSAKRALRLGMKRMTGRSRGMNVVLQQIPKG